MGDPLRMRFRALPSMDTLAGCLHEALVAGRREGRVRLSLRDLPVGRAVCAVALDQSAEEEARDSSELPVARSVHNVGL